MQRMIQLGTSCRACITTSPTFSPNFLCSGWFIEEGQGEERKDPVVDLDVEGQKSCDDAHGSPEVHLVDRKRSLVKGSDSEPEFEANFRHWGHKWCETVVPRGDRVNLGMMF